MGNPHFPQTKHALTHSCHLMTHSSHTRHTLVTHSSHTRNTLVTHSSHTRHTLVTFITLITKCIWHCFECEMGLSQHKSPKSFAILQASERSETSAEITHRGREFLYFFIYYNIFTLGSHIQIVFWHGAQLKKKLYMKNLFCQVYIMPYAFSRTISDVMCTFKRFHNFIFQQSARWVYLGPGVKVGSLFWSARNTHHTLITHS